MPLPTSDDPVAARLIDALQSALISSEQEAPDERIGGYKLIEKIGVGGFGTVWMADQLEPVRRRVALKIVKAGMDTEEVITRFEAERQALALMDHPNIARVFDAGATAGGRPYFVMELVRGVPITHYCDENRLMAEERLRLFIPVCQAVQHAHQKGVIHRDLKPSNVLVTLHDGQPVPKVIDFGIAKAIDRKLTEKTLVTHFHAFIGTPLYTSPEQMEMSAADVDTRSDVYSLGVLLYELLAGQPPFDAKTLVDAGLDAMRRTIREVDPPRPSHRLRTLPYAERTSIAERRRTDAVGLCTLLSGDVDWIVMRCLEKNRARRYETASALALDIERHLQDQPVFARPPSAAYRVSKFVRRHRTGVAAVAAVMVSLVGGLIAASTLFVREQAAHARASAAEQAESRLRQQAEDGREAEAQRASRTSQALAEQLFQERRSGEALAHLVRAARSDPQNFVIGPRLISALAYRNFLLPIGVAIADVDNAGYMADRRRIWTYRISDAADQSLLQRSILPRAPRRQEYPADGELQIRDPADGRVLYSFKVEAEGRSAETTDGTRLAIGRRDGSVVVFNSTTGRAELGPMVHGSRLTALVFSAAGRWLATAGEDSSVKLWDAANGELRATLPVRRPSQCLAFDPDGGRLVTATELAAEWRVWRVPEGEPLSASHREPVNVSSVLFNPDGTQLVMTDNDGAQVFGFGPGDSTGRRLRHDGGINSAEFSPDGTLLATAAGDGMARVWEISTGREKFAFQHGGGVPRAKFTPDGRLLVTNSADGAVRVWDLVTGQAAMESLARPRVVSLALAPDGRTFITQGDDRVARRWALSTRALQPIRLPRDPHRLDFKSQANLTARALYRDRIEELELLSGRIVAVRQLPAPIVGGALSPGAKLAVVDLGMAGCELWDLRGAKILRHKWEGLTLIGRFSDDLACFASIDADSNLRVWDIASGRRLVGPVPGVPARSALSFSPDHARVVGLTPNRKAVVWDLRTGERIGEPLHNPGVFASAFSPDGRWLATASDGIVRLTDARTARPVGAPLVHRTLVNMMVFNRDSQQMLACSRGEVQLWNLATREPVGRPLIGGIEAVRADFTADETRIVTLSRSGEAWIWDRASGCLIADPLRMSGRMGRDGLELVGQLMMTSRVVPQLGQHVEIWPMPPPTAPQPAPEWLLRLATAIAGGEIDVQAGLRELPFDARAFDEIRNLLATLPTDAPFAEWGRWFLADPTTRPIAPGFKVTAAEAQQLAQTSGP